MGSASVDQDAEIATLKALVAAAEAERDATRLHLVDWLKDYPLPTDYVPQGIAIELLDMLTAAGMDKHGLGNTLFGMTMAAVQSVAQLRARVEQLAKDTPPAAQLERWKKLEEDNARLQRLLSWTQGCVVRAARALAVVLRDESFDGANLATVAHGVARGLMDVDAAITTGEPTRAEEVPS